MDKTMDDMTGQETSFDEVETAANENVQDMAVHAMAEELRDRAQYEGDDVDRSLADRPEAGVPFGVIMANRLERRSFLKGAGAVASLPLVGGAVGALGAKDAHAAGGDTLDFVPIVGTADDQIIVPEGYEWYPVIEWGQSLSAFTPDLSDDDIRAGRHLRPAGARNQGAQFGYNCDAIEFFPLPTPESDGRNNALVCVNHEFLSGRLLFEFENGPTAPGVDDIRNAANVLEYMNANPAAARFSINAVGVAVAEIERKGGRWQLVQSSGFNQRITLNTPIRMGGPASNSKFLKTNANPNGRVVRGTYNNCASGATPWGTYLTCEENFEQPFGNFDSLVARLEAEGTDEAKKLLDMHSRIPPNGGVSRMGLEGLFERFDVDKEPNEMFRFGWVVEIDPYDPAARPVKRTAMGRFKHEGAATIVAPDGRLVAYMGDDARFEYAYKFVTERKVNTRNRRANRNLLDRGTLYVAKFNDDGTGEWMPVDYDSQQALRDAKIEGTDIPQFENQDEVLINVRRAADILGATPMDRPEDFEANPVTRKAYLTLTNNSRREEANIVNPRIPNRWGHIVEMTEDGNDNAATSFTWEIFLMAGDPTSGEGSLLTSKEDLNDINNGSLTTNDTYYAGFPFADQLASIGSPDNIGFDNDGNLWIVTDGAQPRGNNDGAFAVPTEGPNRGFLRQFMSSVPGSEVCGARFTPDNKTLFLNIQHPGDRSGFRIGNPLSNFPKFEGNSEPRPTLIGVRRLDNKRVGK
ncbi:MAG: PhoX family phosphatase [Sphingomonadales bacterium]